MNRNDTTLLIDAIVRQTVVLIAQMATTGGQRAPLAHVANQVFLGLVQELQSQGVNQKVTADMFGMALRTYQRKRQRLMESATDQGQSLWEAILRFIQKNDLVTRAEVMTRFRRDDEGTVRGILNDLVESGLVFKTGYSHSSRYRAASEADQATDSDDYKEIIASLVRVAIYHNSPMSYDDLAATMVMEEDELEESLNLLLADGRITREERDGQEFYLCDSFLIPYGDEVGWAAAVFDHYQAMVGAICAKLRQGSNKSNTQDAIGGSTFTFDLWENHPFENEVLGLLLEQRTRVQTLRERVEQFNEGVLHPDEMSRVIFYLGQNVLSDRNEEEA